jgi:hypothetical protein
MTIAVAALASAGEGFLLPLGDEESDDSWEGMAAGELRVRELELEGYSSNCIGSNQRIVTAAGLSEITKGNRDAFYAGKSSALAPRP